MPVPRVLVVEDDDGAREALGCLLAEEGYAVRTAPTGHAALDCARDFAPDAVVCDFYLPDLDGLEVMRRLRAEQAGLFIIMVTAGRCGVAAERALRTEADVFLDKPVDLARLRAALQRVGRGAGSATKLSRPSTERNHPWPSTRTCRTS